MRGGGWQSKMSVTTYSHTVECSADVKAEPSKKKRMLQKPDSGHSTALTTVTIVVRHSPGRGMVIVGVQLLLDAHLIDSGQARSDSN